MQSNNKNNALLMEMVEDSRIEIPAADAAKSSWTQINKTASAGDATPILDTMTGWKAGDRKRNHCDQF